MDKEILMKTVSRLVSPPKGILAIDESSPTCNKRFENLGVETTEGNRREYRELLITTQNIEKYISGYILFDETIKQSTIDGKSFVSIMQSKGLDIGIKVDTGTKDLPNHEGEKLTSGLEGLSIRLEEYKKMGASFAKWRAVYSVSNSTPSEECMKVNARNLAEYASLCQEYNIVPIVEPEVLFDGNYSIERSYEVNAQNLNIVFTELKNKNVYIPGMILKTSMVLAGKDASSSSTEDIAKMTLKCLKENVPEDIGGIVFLSGGQDDIEVIKNLNFMHQVGTLPWPLTFSFGRAIQNKAQRSWAKNRKDIIVAQKLLLERAKASSLASIGEYIE